MTTAKALREIRFYQKSVSHCIPRLSFSKVVRAIALNLSDTKDLRFQTSALEALHDATEAMLVSFFES